MVSLTNSLTRKDPELAEEWHPTKNGILTPAEITFGSNKKIKYGGPVQITSGNPPSLTELQEGTAALSVQGIEHQSPIP